jgi:hypothetical protein
MFVTFSISTGSALAKEPKIASSSRGGCFVSPRRRRHRKTGWIHYHQLWKRKDLEGWRRTNVQRKEIKSGIRTVVCCDC